MSISGKPDIECEAIRAKILLCKNSHLLVGVYYGSPNSSDEESDNLLKSIENATNSCALIFGDFITTQLLIGRNWMDIALVNILDKVTDLFLTQQVKQPTRVPNILDLVFTTEPEMVNDVEVREHLANCDHNILTWKLACDATQETKLK